MALKLINQDVTAFRHDISQREIPHVSHHWRGTTGNRGITGKGTDMDADQAFPLHSLPVCLASSSTA